MATTQGLLHRQAVEELFDDYAETFEGHLVDVLKYRGPEVIAELVHELAAPGGPEDLGVLVDLGCGTGLCAVALRPYASRLVGIDISEGMLEVARSKGRDGAPGGQDALYDETLCMDAAVGLSKQAPSSVDNIIAGDMFIYVWSVDRVLEACARALRPGGLLIFTTESMQEEESEEGWVERESERFAHARSFILRACERHGFGVERAEAVSLRCETNPDRSSETPARESQGAAGDKDSAAADLRYLPADVFAVRKL